jgi:hypothetical protein
MTGAGDSAQLEVFLRTDWDDMLWLDDGGPYLDRAQTKALRDICGWVYRSGDSHFYQYGGGAGGFVPLPAKSLTPLALGTGSGYVKGAINALLPVREQLGLTTRQLLLAAMDAACATDLYSGGVIRCTKLKVTG